MKVSIIMPVYNASNTLQKSLQSIAAQSFRNFEVVFTDDSSNDDTLSLISEFSTSTGIASMIIRHTKNRGVAAARNSALNAATGDYLAFVDADDTIEPQALAMAVAIAEKEHSDIVGWDWTLGFEKNGRYMRQSDYSTPLEALKNLMGGTMRWNLWLFLLRRSFVEENALRFNEGDDMGEDMMFMTSAFCKAKKVDQIHSPLYRYNAGNTSSISRSISEIRQAEVTRNLLATEAAVKESDYAAELEEYVNYLKLFIKLPLLLSPEKEDFERWLSWFPESNEYASSNKSLPLRTRTLQKMAANHCRIGVKLYYLLVYKLVYGIIYK